MIKKLLYTFSLLLLSTAGFSQISTLPASEGFEATFTQGTAIEFIPNWLGSTVAASNKIFQDLTDFNTGLAALSMIPTSAFNGDVQVKLNLTSYQSVAVSFMAKSMLNGIGTRDVVLTMSTSIDGGTTWIGSSQIASLPNANQTSFTSYSYSLPVEANNQANVLVKFYATRGATGTSTAAKLVIDDVLIQQVTTPQITLSQTALTFTQVLGLPTQTQTVNVSGSNLSGNINLTAPANFEISTSATSGFSSSVSLPTTNGNLLVTPVYVRMNATAAGTFTGNLTAMSTGISAPAVALTGSCIAPTVTNPTPYDVTMPPGYSFTSWDNTNAAGTFPPSMALWSHATADPDLNTPFIEDWSCLYNLTARSRFTGEGTNGISMINTGNSQFTGVCDGTNPTQTTGTTLASGRAGAIVLALNTVGVNPAISQVSINWTGRTILQNVKVCALRMQYRIGTAQGNPNAGWQEFPTTQEYISGADNTFEIKTTTLPSSCSNQPVVQVRWVYYFVSGTGLRAQLALDDISTSIANLSTNDNFAYDSKDFQIYPNPTAKQIVHLSTAQNIEVFDLAGKIISSQKNASTIDTTSFAAGIYFVKTDTGITKKLIVE